MSSKGVKIAITAILFGFLILINLNVISFKKIAASDALAFMRCEPDCESQNLAKQEEEEIKKEEDEPATITRCKPECPTMQIQTEQGQIKVRPPLQPN